MQIPSPKTGSDQLLVYGAYHLQALAETPETAGLIPNFQAAQNDVKTAMRATEDARLALVGPRVAARFSEYALEGVLRRLASAAHGRDGNLHSGAAFDAVFTHGVEAATRPRGAAQVKIAKDVATALGTRPAAAELRTEFTGVLSQAIAHLEARLEARKTAGIAVAVASAHELGARETWVHTYDGNAGALRHLFPKQTTRQDLYFDEVDSAPHVTPTPNPVSQAPETP